MLVMKKKTQFMMPNTKLAFNIAHCLLAEKCRPLTVAEPRIPKEIWYEFPEVTDVQFWWVMPRSS
jgi:hypothetical protein